MSRNRFQILLFTWVGASLAMAQPLPQPGTGEFRPGEVWRDTDGQPINAHGGGVLFHESVYYRYGEVKEGRTSSPDRSLQISGRDAIAP
jgi:hypothetical protein